MSKRLSLEEIKSKKYGRLTVLREVEPTKICLWTNKKKYALQV